MKKNINTEQVLVISVKSCVPVSGQFCKVHSIKA
ncbi:hypothetical protein B0I21_106237 [Sphingobacterium paludis]|uniref:Uncharacterized protein n=1 Tax=Sphingobacterium paludis TaxID=1476465 RepID=A0A4R7CVE0_9SPHI|nr:hypothetical protein B0I21_106237 [Sphingobacterium paludis]